MHFPKCNDNFYIPGDVFPIDISKTWEFNPKFPIRNILIPKLVFAPPLHLIRVAHPYALHYCGINLKSPYCLLVIPRLFICALSLVNDYCLYKICVLYGQNYKNRLRIFASSYVALVYCSRGFSNTFEMIFFSILLLLVSQCMYKSDRVIYHDEFLREKYEKAETPVEKVKLFKLQTHLPAHSLTHVAAIATITVVGIFNRPTFVGFAFPPLFFWLHRGLGSKVVGFKDFHIRIFSLLLCSVPSALLLILIDSGYYGYLTMADIEAAKISWDSWVVTPINFLRYNLDPINLSSHGLHPRWQHLCINIPLLFNVLGILAFIILLGNLYRFIRGHFHKLPRLQSITGLMLCSLVTPVCVLSLFQHQEARFIIPTLVPLVYLYGNHLHVTECDDAQIKKLKTFFLSSWYMSNIVLTLFYGFVHQGGIYLFTNKLYYEMKQFQSYGVHTHVITTHSYSIPTYLLQIESTTATWHDRASGNRYKLAPNTFIHKYGSLPIKDLYYKIDEVLSDAEMMLHEDGRKYRFYVVSPCSLEESLMKEGWEYYYFELVPETSYYPHFCMEALPSFPTSHDQYCFGNVTHYHSNNHDLNIFERLYCYFSRFCLKVYSVKATLKEKPRRSNVRNAS